MMPSGVGVCRQIYSEYLTVFHVALMWLWQDTDGWGWGLAAQTPTMVPPPQPVSSANPRWVGRGFVL
jgi:hypothetical protein